MFFHNAPFSVLPSFSWSNINCCDISKIVFYLSAISPAIFFSSDLDSCHMVANSSPQLWKIITFMEFSDDTENISHLLDLAFDFRRLERTLQFQGLLQVDSMLICLHKKLYLFQIFCQRSVGFAFDICSSALPQHKSTGTTPLLRSKKWESLIRCQQYKKQWRISQYECWQTFCQRNSSHSVPHISKRYFEKIDSRFTSTLGSLVSCHSSGDTYRLTNTNGTKLFPNQNENYWGSSLKNEPKQDKQEYLNIHFISWTQFSKNTWRVFPLL